MTAIIPGKSTHLYESDWYSDCVRMSGKDIKHLTTSFFVQIIYFKFCYQEDTPLSQQSIPHCTKKNAHTV
jgi:hypothetical protein